MRTFIFRPQGESKNGFQVVVGAVGAQSDGFTNMQCSNLEGNDIDSGTGKKYRYDSQFPPTLAPSDPKMPSGVDWLRLWAYKNNLTMCEYSYETGQEECYDDVVAIKMTTGQTMVVTEGTAYAQVLEMTDGFGTLIARQTSEVVGIEVVEAGEIVYTGKSPAPDGESVEVVMEDWTGEAVGAVEVQVVGG